MLNAVGFQLLFSAYNIKINKELDIRIDEGSKTGIQTVIYKVPIQINLPYLSSKPIENDLKGELDYKGNIYRYVKSTICKDTIYYECIVNKQGKVIKNAFKDYLSKNSENPNSKKSTGFVQKVLKNYLTIPFLMLPLIELTSLKSKTYFSQYDTLWDICLDLNVPPPRVIS